MAKSSATSRPRRSARFHEAVEVLQGPELRMDGRVAALLAADRPRASGIAGRGRERVVASLAKGAADGMDGRQVHDIEAHGRDALQLTLGVLEGGVQPVAARRAREHLVPGGEARPLAIGHHRVLARAPGRALPVEVAGHERGQGWLTGHRTPPPPGRGRRPCARRRRAAHAPRSPPRAGPRPRSRPRPSRSSLATSPPGIDPLGEVGQPGEEGIRQRLDEELVAAVPLERERARPAIVVHVLQGSLAPILLPGAAIADPGDQHVVTFLEDVGRHLHELAHLATWRGSARRRRPARRSR